VLTQLLTKSNSQLMVRTKKTILEVVKIWFPPDSAFFAFTAETSLYSVADSGRISARIQKSYSGVTYH